MHDKSAYNSAVKNFSIHKNHHIQTIISYLISNRQHSHRKFTRWLCFDGYFITVVKSLKTLIKGL